MPYVVCARCQLRTYSAALWATTEVCPRCDSELPRPATVIELAGHPRFARDRDTAAQPGRDDVSADGGRPTRRVARVDERTGAGSSWPPAAGRRSTPTDRAVGARNQ